MPGVRPGAVVVHPKARRPLRLVCASPEACTQVPLVEASTAWSSGVDAGTTRWKGGKHRRDRPCGRMGSRVTSLPLVTKFAGTR